MTIDEAVGELLLTGNSEGLSRNSQRASVSFPMPLHNGIAWEGLFQCHIQGVAGLNRCTRGKIAGSKGHEKTVSPKKVNSGVIDKAGDIGFSTEPGIKIDALRKVLNTLQTTNI